MTPIRARYYDGVSSRQRDVLISAEAPDRLRVSGEGVDARHRLADVRVSARVGDTPRHLRFADGSQCETADNDGVDLLFSGVGSAAAGRLLHGWESRLRYALLAAALTVVLLGAGITYGIPALAKYVAYSLPASVEQAIGRDVLAGLDRVLLEPSELSEARRRELHDMFAQMAAGVGRPDYRLELRASRRLGANAIAFPPGIVVLTDALVLLAAGDDELIAVLAHEMGHLERRHALRRVLQDSATALLVAALAGDITSASTLAAGLPTLLLQGKYSRDFEREADAFALEYLNSRGLRADSFGAILERMERQKAAGPDIPDYLSTHPATRERVERAQGAR